MYYAITGFFLSPTHGLRFAFAVTCLFAIGGNSASAQELRRFGLESRDGAAITAVAPHAGPDERPGSSAATGISVSQDAAGGASRGEDWQSMSVPPGLYLRAISMGSPQVGFAAGELGVVLKSVDGGSSWQFVLNQGFPYYWYGVHAFDENTVVISGFQNQTGEGIIRWSTTGGTSWGPVIGLPAPTSLDWLTRIEFSDRNHGVIQGLFGQVQATSTGGAAAGDWTASTPSQNWFEGTFTTLPGGLVYIGGYDNVRSSNHGFNWTPLTDADPLFDGPISMLASGRGFIGGGTISPTVTGWMYGTMNEGVNWTPNRVLETPYPIRTIRQLDSSVAFAAGGNVFGGVGGIWGTSNGTDWALQRTTNAEMLDLDWVRINCGQVNVFAVGSISSLWRATVELYESIPGDFDADRDVDLSDLAVLLANYGTASCQMCTGDLDGDGDVDLNDLTMLLSNYGRTC
jgi:hypothetical protein